MDTSKIQAQDTAKSDSMVQRTPLRQALRWMKLRGEQDTSESKKSSDLVIHPFFRLDFYHLSVYAVFEQRQDNLRFVPDSAESNSALSWTALRWKCF